jgi:diaminopimelate decarboxylase
MLGSSMSAPHAPSAATDPDLLESIARRVGTPFWLIEAPELRRRIADIRRLIDGEGLQARYAMKANPATRILREIRSAGLWIDAVSAYECQRARLAGFAAGHQPPEILYTADVFRGPWQQSILEEGILPNLGSPGMVEDLREAGYRGPVALRVNVGFGHGHVNACDTGGPSSKHGIWWQDLDAAARAVDAAGCRIVMLHAHVGSGPQQEEFRANLTRLASFFASLAPRFPHLEAVSLGGGLPYNYRTYEPLDLTALHAILTRARADISAAVGRPIRLEIEPGRYFVVSCTTLVARVHDVKSTQTNEKGNGVTFAMVDAGFTDLIRPAMYGSHHRISIPARAGQPEEPLCVAGPLCESGDVFTRGADEMLAPRLLPRPRRGDLLCLHDAGAYGYAMSSHYNSLGRAPQIWLEEDGRLSLISRRETLDDLLRAECDQPLS